MSQGSPDEPGYFGALLKEIRVVRRNSLSHIAKKVGITRQFYHSLENGRRFPTLPVFALLWDVMGFDADEVLDAIDVPLHEFSPGDIASPLPVPDVAGHFIAFGQRLAQAAIDAHISRPELAHAIGETEQRVASDETGRTVPTVPRFAQLRRVLDFYANDMLPILADPSTFTPFAGFGYRIQAARIAYDQSSAQVIQEIGCDPIQYERVELGIEMPTPDLLIQIHRVTRFDVRAALTSVWANDAQLGPDKRDVIDEREVIDDNIDDEATDDDTHGSDSFFGTERHPLDSDRARRELALSIWPQRMVDAAAEHPIEDTYHDLEFWRRVDEQLLQDMLLSDSALTNLGSYIRFSQDTTHRRVLIQVILGLHPDARDALDPSILGALLDHGFAPVSAAVRSRLQEGDPVLLDYLRRAIARSYSPRNSTESLEQAHRREQEAWRQLMTLLLDPLIYPVCILDALRTGIMHHLHRGIRQGTIEAKPYQLTDVRFVAKFTNSHEAMILRAYRLLGFDD